MAHDNQFYVYEHWRPDKDVCFYVGKGKRNRAYKIKRRNAHHQSIVRKLFKLGLFVEVRLVKGSLLEHEALSLEIERISFWRSVGVRLSNKTDGGEGTSGYSHPKELSARIGKMAGEKLKGRKRPQEVIEKIKLTKNSPERIKLVREQLFERWKNPSYRKARQFDNKGKPLSKDHCEKISSAKMGHIVPQETRLKIKESYNKTIENTKKKLRYAWVRRKARGDVPWNKGKTKSEVLA